MQTTVAKYSSGYQQKSVISLSSIFECTCICSKTQTHVRVCKARLDSITKLSVHYGWEDTALKVIMEPV